MFIVGSKSTQTAHVSFVLLYPASVKYRGLRRRALDCILTFSQNGLMFVSDSARSTRFQSVPYLRSPFVGQNAPFSRHFYPNIMRTAPKQGARRFFFWISNQEGSVGLSGDYQCEPIRLDGRQRCVDGPQSLSQPRHFN